MGENIEIKDFSFMGYVTFYIAIYSEDKATIVKYESDFRKPITEEFIKVLVKEIISYYNKRFNMNVTNIQFVSKEAYDAYSEEYKAEETDLEITWNGDECFINGEKTNS